MYAGRAHGTAGLPVLRVVTEFYYILRIYRALKCIARGVEYVYIIDRVLGNITSLLLYCHECRRHEWQYNNRRVIFPVHG